MPKKKDSLDEYDKLMLELAIHTRNFMRKRGAFIDPDEANEIKHGYVTVAEICEVLDVPQSQWKDIKRKLISMGEPITIDDFGGHYLGKPGSQAKNPAMLIARAMTMLETASFQIIALQGLNDWDKCQSELEKLVSANRHNLSLNEIPKLLKGAGIKVSSDFEQVLLVANTELLQQQ